MTKQTSDLTIEDYEETFKDRQRLVRKIDVIINGEDGAAQQASLCDVVGQIEQLVIDNKNLGQDLKAANDLIREIGVQLK